jgi:hypothetical protein
LTIHLSLIPSIGRARRSHETLLTQSLKTIVEKFNHLDIIFNFATIVPKMTVPNDNAGTGKIGDQPNGGVFPPIGRHFFYNAFF